MAIPETLATAKLPNVVEVERLFEEPDYMLRVLARDLTAYQEFYDHSLTALPGMQRLTSTLVMNRVHAERTGPSPERHSARRGEQSVQRWGRSVPAYLGA